ncbi:MAG: ModD protein [Sulfurospirillaceae bacterium]|nr:ModD protein [Sulfurospirillaceae bacterium]
MIQFLDSELLAMVYDDVGLYDLTAEYLEVDTTALGEVTFFTREETVCAGINVAKRMCELFSGVTVFEQRDGSHVKANDPLLIVRGNGVELMKMHKVAQNVLEYSCGIAKRTHKMVSFAKEVFPDIEIATTRKHIVGAKKLSINAAIAGGGIPHRLGLYDSILIFPYYFVFKEDRTWQTKKYREKKIGFEAKSIEEALKYVKDVDMIQLDKEEPTVLKKSIESLRALNPRIIIALAGGINEHNVREYAACFPDIIVSSAPYFAKPVDIGAKLVKIEHM